MEKSMIVKLLQEISNIMTEKKEYLIEIDSIVGDGDLGLTMSDGFLAAYKFSESSEETDIGKLVYGAGKVMSTAVPSTMGTLMASGLMQAGKELKGKTEIQNSDFVVLFEGIFNGVANRGKAKVGEKTFLDGLYPAVEAMKKLVTLVSLSELATEAKIAAEQGFKNTTTMIAVHGRAATRGEMSRALEDPGAAVAYLMMCAFEKAVK